MEKISAWRIMLVIFIFGLNPSHLSAQSDSIILAYDEFLENIIQYHPIAKKADLRLRLAQAETMSARGNLDPEIFSDWNQKNFDDKLYYRQYRTELKLPTPLGIDLVGGYENTEGVFLNPENNTDDLGLWNLGVEANVLQGLIVNERKTAIEQAKVFQRIAENEQQLILNDLIYNATASYLIWQQYTYFHEVLIENQSIAITYFQNTKQSYLNGEKTAMDTLEAFLAFQDAKVLLQKNEMGLIKSRQALENFLWFDDTPIGLQPNTIPESYQNQFLPEFILFENSALANHPSILFSINKLTSLEIEQKLKREKLKPKFKVKYNPLLATSPNDIRPNFSTNNYKWGFDFAFPLLLRSERASIQKGEIKIQETQLDLDNKRNKLQNKIQNSWEQQIALQEQTTLISANVDNYKLLLDGENEKFRFGESSVFLLNRRQEKYISGQLKLIETYISRQTELLNFLYFSNQLIN